MEIFLIPDNYFEILKRNDESCYFVQVYDEISRRHLHAGCILKENMLMPFCSMTGYKQSVN